MIQPLFEHRLTLAGYDTRVLELEGDGAPIVLFHGYADSADTWRQTLALLGREGRRAIAVDLPGFGAADGLRQDEILPQLDEFAVAAVAYLRGRRGPRVVAVGNSLGGCLVLRLAERQSAQLAGVVGVAPAGLEMSRLLSLVERDPILTSILALPVPVPSAVVRAAVARLYLQLAFAAPASVDPRVVATFTRHLRHRATAARYLETAHRLLPELRDPFELDRISCPVLLVWGDRDRLVFPRGARQLLDAVPNARLELMDGIGHCPQVEAADRFAKILLDFTGEPAAAAA
ncbi:MAG TPA: alpha/beta fold hydrolase [Solirubrobacteraceae bacterium]